MFSFTLHVLHLVCLLYVYSAVLIMQLHVYYICVCVCLYTGIYRCFVFIFDLFSVINKYKMLK